MTTADRTIHAIDSVLDAHEAAYHPGIACPETQEGRCALARPVESPEDRMADARTDTTDRSFAAYLTAQERDQLDARAATAEAERDEALDDRDAYKEARDVLRKQLDQAHAELERARNQRDAAWKANDRHRQELGAAGEVLAVVRDAAERIDRALATYDTTPSEGSVTITLDNSAGTFTPRHPGDALADALRNAYSAEQLASLHEHLVEQVHEATEREDPLGRLVDALFAARWQTQPPALGSLPPRAQDDRMAALASDPVARRLGLVDATGRVVCKCPVGLCRCRPAEREG